MDHQRLEGVRAVSTFDTQAFASAGGDPRFRKWLEGEREQALTYLSQATDPMMIYRAQGKLALVNDMFKLIEANRRQST